MRTNRVWHSGIVAHRARVAGISLLVCAIAIASLEGSYAQSLTWLGTLPGGDWSHPWGISADGSVVVGYAGYNSDGAPHAFRWTRTGGMQDLGTLPGGNSSAAFGISADGSTIVGDSGNASGEVRAVLWTVSTGGTITIQDLGALGGDQAVAYAASADGSVIVGRSKDARGYWIAFRWTPSGGMQGLGSLSVRPPGSGAYDVSANGDVVVGSSLVQLPQGGSAWHAFRWTRSSGMQSLGTLPNGTNSGAIAVSLDGSVIIGLSDDASGQNRAFRWTQAGGMQDIGVPSGYNYVDVKDVSADGNVIVGMTSVDLTYEDAVRWTLLNGWDNLNQTFANLLTDGSHLYEASAISADGRYIVGNGYNAQTGKIEAFLLDTGSCSAHNGDVDGNNCVDDADLLAVLFAFGSSGSGLGRIDVNCDGMIDDADLLIVLFNFGSGC